MRPVAILNQRISAEICSFPSRQNSRRGYRSIRDVVTSPQISLVYGKPKSNIIEVPVTNYIQMRNIDNLKLWKCLNQVWIFLEYQQSASHPKFFSPRKLRIILGIRILFLLLDQYGVFLEEKVFVVASAIRRPPRYTFTDHRRKNPMAFFGREEQVLCRRR